MANAKQKSNQVMGGSWQDLSAERAAKRNDSDKSKASAQPSGKDELIYDQHAEDAVLKAIFRRNEHLDGVAGPLNADDFFPRNQKLFLAMKAERAAGLKFDVITMEATLRQKGRLRDVGGTEHVSELLDLADMETSEEVLRRHVQTIKRYSSCRAAQHDGELLTSEAQLAVATPESLLAFVSGIKERMEARQNGGGIVQTGAMLSTATRKPSMHRR